MNHFVIYGTLANDKINGMSEVAAETFEFLDIQTKKEKRNFFIVPIDFHTLTGFDGKIDKKMTGEEFTVAWVPDEQDQPKEETSLSVEIEQLKKKQAR